MDITGFVKEIEKQNLNCEGIVVLQHGAKVAEHRWIPEERRSCYSAAKSFISVAVGMAIDRGKLSLKCRVTDIFPECAADPLAATLTLEHLLSMSRGHENFSRPPTVAEALAQLLAFAPGTHFVYDNGNFLLASAMITRAMGITARDFLIETLFGPLGIPDPDWPASPDGHTIGGTGLSVTTSELARFGQFLLQKGQWQGKQLVSAAWIDHASRPHIHTFSRQPDNDLGYGLGFWPSRHGAYRADGKEGQYVIVLPQQDAVVAINSSEPKPEGILDAVWEEILPLL